MAAKETSQNPPQTADGPVPHTNEANMNSQETGSKAAGASRQNEHSKEEPQVEMVQDDAATQSENELAACQDRLLRLQAEMENLRRRTAREIADERRYAPLPIVRDLLEVLDNVDRAVEAGEKSADAAGLLEGFRLVAKQLRSVLQKHEVQAIAAEGEPFDPNLHEAILHQPSDKPTGTVVTVTKGGYQLHDRVVRPSQVIVSAGKEEGK